MQQTNQPTLINKDQHIIAEIRAGKNGCIEKLYSRYRNEFLLWGRRNFALSDDQLKDVFQDLVIDFHANVVSGKLTELSSSLKTYLFQLGKNKLINLVNREKRITYGFDPELIKGQEQRDYMNEEDRLYKLEQVKAAIEKLPEDCQQVLKLYYFNEYDMTSIAREMGYKNADTAKSKKSLCMKKLFAELNKLKMFLML